MHRAGDRNRTPVVEDGQERLPPPLRSGILQLRFPPEVPVFDDRIRPPLVAPSTSALAARRVATCTCASAPRPSALAARWAAALAARWAAACAAVLALAACAPADGPADTAPDGSASIEPARAVATSELGIPARGAPETFDVATWNLDWFGDDGNGPTDEALQLDRVREVVAASGLDLWALQEVVDAGAFRRLVDGLPGWEGLLADEPAVEGGAEWYEGFGDREQKVALLYRSEAVELLGARVILTEKNRAFAGRPPVEIRLRARTSTGTSEAIVVLIHAKAAPDEASWNRRRDAADALHAYLDDRWATMPVWVLGDFNDDVDTSIRRGSPTPYARFVEDGEWRFVTESLSRQGVSSTVGYDDVIDHHLVSDEVAGGYVTGSVEAFRVDEWIPSYASTTTDHFPVLARYGLPGG